MALEEILDAAKAVGSAWVVGEAFIYAVKGTLYLYKRIYDKERSMELVQDSEFRKMMFQPVTYQFVSVFIKGTKEIINDYVNSSD